MLHAFREPTTRQGMVGVLRQWFLDQESLSFQAVSSTNRDAVSEDASPEALRQAEARAAIESVLAGEIPVRAVANTRDDVVTALRISMESGLNLVVDVGAGAYEVAGLLADAGVPVVVGPAIMGLGGGGDIELAAHTAESAARLERAGVRIALSTNDRGGRSVVTEAVVARAHGLSWPRALRAVTLDAARILGVADRIGSIEPGKDADMVVWDGTPLTTWGAAAAVFVDGALVFDRRDVPVSSPQG